MWQDFIYLVTLSAVFVLNLSCNSLLSHSLELNGRRANLFNSFNQSFIHFYFLRTRNCRPVSHSRCCDRNLADAVVGWHNWKVWIVLTKNQRAKRLVLKNSMLQICSRCYCFRSFIYFSPNCLCFSLFYGYFHFFFGLFVVLIGYFCVCGRSTGSTNDYVRWEPAVLCFNSKPLTLTALLFI